jgi:hypothetical protein
MKKTSFLFSVGSLFPSLLFALGLDFHGSLKNSVYSYESEKTHTRIYQYGRLHLATPQNRVTLSGSFRALTDANESLDSDERLKAYSLKIKFANLLSHRVDVSIGRQFLYPGTALGAIDGIHADVRVLSKLSLQLFGGSESSFDRAFKTYEIKDSFVAGGLMQVKNFYATGLQMLYLQKSNQSETYWQLAGVNLDNNSIRHTSFSLQSHYDLQNKRMHRLLVSARRNWAEEIQTTLEYRSQYPQIYANSFFTIFETEAYQQFRFAGAVEFLPAWYAEAQAHFIRIASENANRLFLNLRNENGSIGLAYESGYLGDQFGLAFDYGYQISPQIIASIYIDYSKYRTEKIYEYEDELGNAARVSYKINRNWKVDLEYQWLTNRLKDSDSRLLNHVAFIW